MNHHTLLAHFPKITYVRYKKLNHHFANLSEVFETAELGDIIKAGWEEHIADEFIHWREKTDFDAIISILEKEQINTISINEEAYPKLLAEIPDPPHTLFFRGALPDKDLPSIAVVGTRHHTSYGKQVCEDLVRELAAQHLIIVSGLALGIDGIAHETTLATHGKTIAVLGSGINREGVYPSFHKNLAEKIIDTGGALISEYPPYFLPTHYSFPARNRIIAGLTLGTLVIEAPRESGSLITAKHALDYNREVLSVPHPITSLRGEGCNTLIKLGASLVRSAQDVMEALNLKNVQQLVENRHSIPSSPTEEAIAKILSKEPLHIDAIIKHTRLESHCVNSTLLLMEMKGIVQNVGAMRYVLK